MKRNLSKRMLAIVLTICLVAALIPISMPVEAEATISGVDSLTCAGFISNSTRQNYIDTMMKYYINNYSSLQSALNSYESVVFMFEGGSDYYDSYEYVDASYYTRLQAVCIVVQLNASGRAEIVFHSEECSSIPDDANYVSVGSEGSGSTTILDGIYKMTTVNHNGNYAAHTTNCYTGWYTPYKGSTGYSSGCYGINIHTRSTSYNLINGGQSMGCQLIGYGASSSNDYNEFMKVVAGISFNAYDGTQRTFSSTGAYNGYYVVDRQLGLLSPDGTEYGSGSLIELYTKGDLNGITSFSTNARANANFGYLSECTPYPAHCQVEVTMDTTVHSLPCSTDTADSYVVESVSKGKVYTATKLYKNSYGNFWYEVTTDSGETAYLYGGEAQYIDDIISDITITDYDVPNGHVNGQSFVVSGSIKAPYNRIDTASAWVYSGFGTDGSAVTGYQDTVNGHSYTLANSNIDYNTKFNEVGLGNNTYVISVKYTNYYAEGATTLKSNTGTINLLEEYFVVVSASTSQTSCSHSYTTTTVMAPTCTAHGVQVKACSKCGLIQETNSAATGHSYGAWSVSDATCTADGSRTRKCSACGDTQTEVIPAGHDYTLTIHPGNCSSYAVYEYTCGKCGDNYKLSADQMASTWLEEIPAGMDASQFTAKTQYRYSDYETKTSYESSLAGYTQLSSKWVQSGTKTVNYVKSWSSGFSTSNSLYSQYNKQSSKVTASETATTKTVINSDAIVGYLYHHWCYSGSYYSTQSSSGSYTTFHAYYSTTAPSNYTCDPSDMSYKTSHSGCSNSEWYWPTEVYAQTSTSYKKEFTYERWTDFSAWSDTAVSASSTRKVETRTVYQLKGAELGTHSYTSSITKQPTCTASGIKTFTCSGCGHSYTETIAATGHNYVSKVTAPTCEMAGYTTYTCNKCGNSYTGNSVPATGHNWQNGFCITCGEECGHNYVNGLCTICGMEEPAKDYYLFGWINGVDYACEADYANMGEYKFVDGKLVVTFESDSYVGVKSSRNVGWYFTNGWLGYDTQSATLFERGTLSAPDKLFVPGGVQVTFTLVENNDNTLTLSYETAQKAPTLELKYPTLLLEDEIFMSVYFSMDQQMDLSKVGMLTWNSQPTTVSYASADAVIPGAVLNDNGYYSVNTEAIPAKNLGDTIYFCIYAQMDDGSYVYGKQVSYSPKQFAYSQLGSDVSDETKSLMVAMLNYGAQAQVYFGYKTNALVNKELTTEQKALVKSYSASMMDSIDLPDASKVGPYAATGGFASKYPTVSLEGAFAINYYFTTSYVPDANLMLFYWTEEDYKAATTLSPNNATGRLAMSGTNVFAGLVEGIPAKDLDDTIYVVVGYRSDGVSYCTGVLPYSIGAFCVSQASSGSAEIKPLASAIAVYGYYAKAYFNI